MIHGVDAEKMFGILRMIHGIDFEKLLEERSLLKPHYCDLPFGDMVEFQNVATGVNFKCVEEVVSLFSQNFSC
ncbi:Regulatory E2 [Gossypium australe]|uniref:Regulatory E2 n=1 Tax=Gossypium australe TaxID=47621 RepID=A0A5B6URE6_9ROSI|nr:Regulatory E2 [Gossypium australe]